ncbi:MAG: 4-hydroxybenzoate octaprenyltransferase [Pseudomonadota bacterium]
MPPPPAPAPTSTPPAGGLPPRSLRERLDLYERLMRLDRPVGILLLLWPALWALWLAARGHPEWLLVWVFVIGAVLMRSAGCIVNDVADRDFDRHVRRTAERPITAGRIGVREALVLAAVLTLIAGAIVIVLLDTRTVLLSLLALAVAFTYPYSKRFFALPQAWLGIAFGFGVPMAWSAATGAVPLVAWLLMLANVFWAIAYDTAYAMVDREDDLRIGIRTSAITFGRHDVRGFALAHGLFLVTLVLVGAMSGSGIAYHAGLVIAALMIRHQVRLCATREPSACFRAFMNNIAVGGVVFAAIVVDTRWLRWPLP